MSLVGKLLSFALAQQSLHTLPSHMKNFERTGGQTAYSSLGIIQSRGLTNLSRCPDGEVLAEISSADPLRV